MTETIVPRYYFHMKSKHAKIQDDAGQFFGSAWEAYVRAQEIIRQCLRHIDMEDDEHWLIRVCNDADEPELVVLFPRPSVGSRASASFG